MNESDAAANEINSETDATTGNEGDQSNGKEGT